ncbi:MAG TPA: type III secretion system export apparatus subunit SctT [Acidiphilium sp.]
MTGPVSHFIASGQITGQAYGIVLSLGLGFARALGMMAILPVFSRLQLGGSLRAAVAFSLALIVAPALDAHYGRLHGAADAAVSLSALLFALKEGALGLVLGVVMSVPFWAAEMAGELIDMQRGSQSAITTSSSTGEESGMLGTFMLFLVIAIFMLSGGMNLVLRGFVASFAIWPTFDWLPRFTPSGGVAILRLLDAVTRAGVVIAAPLVVAMLVAEIGLGFINRYAPPINVFDLALGLKGLIVAVGLCVYTLVLVGRFHHMALGLGAIGTEIGHLAPG